MAIAIGGTSFSEQDVEGVEIHGNLGVDPVSGKRDNPHLTVWVCLSNGQRVTASMETSSDEPSEMGKPLFEQLESCGFTGVAYTVSSKVLVPVEPPTGILERVLGLPVYRDNLWVLSSAWVRPGTATYSSVSGKDVAAGLPGGGKVAAYTGDGQVVGNDGTVAGWLRG